LLTLRGGPPLPAVTDKLQPLKLEGGKLVIRNDTDEEWKNVELWLNWYYRAVVPSIPAHGRVVCGRSIRSWKATAGGSTTHIRW
jgi:hypothetical protein